MPNSSMLQVRTNPIDKEKASAILESLGTNLSTVVNMLIKQIIITESIPFEIKLNNSPYTTQESIEETKATMAFESMHLSNVWVDQLKEYALGNISGDELLKKVIDTISDSDIKKDL